MYKVVEALVKVAEEQGVHFEFNSEVTGLNVEGRSIKSVVVNGTSRSFDYVVAGADYHHVEQSLLPAQYRRYTESLLGKPDPRPFKPHLLPRHQQAFAIPAASQPVL